MELRREKMLQIRRVFVLLTVILSCVTAVNSARILGFFPSFSTSHLIVHMSTIRPMIERGHDVTIVTSLPLNKQNLTFRHVQLDLPTPNLDGLTKSSLIGKISLMMQMTKSMYSLSNQTINTFEMQKLMKEESFDLVVFGYFFNDFLLGIAGHFKCPVIVNWMGSPNQNLANLVGNPSEILYVPELLSGLQQPMGFFDRVKNVLTSEAKLLLAYWMEYQNGIYYESNFPSNKYPSYDEMKRNVSMLFVNTYLNQGPIQPNVPALVQIGGIQIKPKPDPLPQDIQKHLDSASKDGAIYFCLGSNLKADLISPDFIKIVFKVLSGLKQNIIWKWDADKLPGESPNILYKKWAPQDDILAHPNVKVFITHAGGGGVAEAQYHGVPMVAIPFFADQFTNANKVHNANHGLTLNKDTITEQSFRDAIIEVLQNPKYKESVQRYSRVYRDRPMSARDTAAYWMEYVIRHKGAQHLQSPAVHMSTISYYGLDVMAFLVAVTYVIFKICKVLCRQTVGRIFSSRNKTKMYKQKTQ